MQHVGVAYDQPPNRSAGDPATASREFCCVVVRGCWPANPSLKLAQGSHRAEGGYLSTCVATQESARALSTYAVAWCCRLLSHITRTYSPVGPVFLLYIFCYEYQRAFLSTSSDANLIINAVGEDRLGIVSDIAGLVIGVGGNVGDSQAAKLGSHFSLMMVVSVPRTSLDDLREQLAAMSDMNAAVFEADGKDVQATPQIGCTCLRFWHFCPSLSRPGPSL